MRILLIKALATGFWQFKKARPQGANPPRGRASRRYMSPVQTVELDGLEVEIQDLEARKFHLEQGKL